jgi:hypothetical protein
MVPEKQSTKGSSTNWVTQKGKRSETKISNIILHCRGFRQERYSETALSEARYSGGYLYNKLSWFITLLPANRQQRVNMAVSLKTLKTPELKKLYFFYYTNSMLVII